MNINKLMKEIREINDKNGWTMIKEAWKHRVIVPTKLCLIHSEISEALEGFRNEDFENFKEEMADILIRTFDLCSGLNIDIEKELKNKLDILRKRTFKHGNKKV